MSKDFLILICVFFTSVLSGFMGLGGGLILMAVLVSLLPVPTTMVLHGIVQMSANGSRAFLLREHIQWKILGTYLLGTILIGSILAMIRFVPDKGVVYLLLGLFPFIGLLGAIAPYLDIEKKGRAFLCGFLVTSAQVSAGASGGVLDVFWVNSRFDRFKVIASKATTQSIGHFCKLLYYGSVLSLAEFTETVSFWVVPTVVLLAFFGTWVGKQILHHINDDRFRQGNRVIILGIGFILISKGMQQLFFA